MATAQKAKEPKKTVSGAFKEVGLEKPPKAITVRLDELQVSPLYQRVANKNRIALFAKQFSPVLCEPLFVSKRKNGELFVVDGNHRRNVLQKQGYTHWLAYVIEGLTSAEEAKLFELLNTQRSNASAAQRFKARLHWKDPIALTIKSTVEKCGFLLVLENLKSRTGIEIHAVEALDRIHRKSNQPGLFQTLDLISYCWDADEIGRTEALTIKGVHLVLTHKLWKGLINMEHLRNKLSATPVSRLLRKARAFTDSQGRNVVSLFADAVILENNKKLKSSSKNWLQPRGMAE